MFVGLILLVWLVSRPSGRKFSSTVSVIIRLALSLTIGIPIFAIGFVLFLITDIFFPEKDKGYKILVRTFKWGSFYWFKGLKMETDDFDVNVAKERRTKD